MSPYRGTSIRLTANFISGSPRYPLQVCALLLLPFVLCGCFYVQATVGQLSLLNDQRRLPKAIQRESNSEHALMLRWVPSILAFARNVMLMDPGKSYRGYVHLDGPGMTYVLSAAQKTRLEAYRWWFPFAGEVEYKSFFSSDEAEQAAAALKTAGYDTYIGPSRAYSTLGYLRDPVSNTMMSDGFAKFVEVLLHEIAHRRLYVPGRTEFNEQLASFVAMQGTLRFLSHSRFDGTGLRAEFERRLTAERVFFAQVRTSAEELQTLYTSDLNDEQKLAERGALFAQLEQSWPGRAPSPTFNNALILQYVRYGRDTPELNMLWQRCAGAFFCFWRGAEMLARSPAERTVK